MNLINLTEEIMAASNAVYKTSGDVYQKWNSGEIKYSALNVALEGATTDEDNITYNFIVYYGDRLLQDDSNLLEVQTDAINDIERIISIIGENHALEITTITPFQQQFSDYLGGVYARINIITPFEIGNCETY